MDNLEILKNIFIFSGFDEAGLTQIHSLLSEEAIRKGDVIYWEGDPPDSLFIIKKGKFKLFKQAKSGKETILRIAGAGETLGSVAIFDGRPHSVAAKAMEASRVIKIPRAEFLDVVRQKPGVAYEIILDLSRRLRDAQDNIQGLAVERVERRIVHLLLKLADRIGHAEGLKVRIPVVLTRQDIADMVGSTVETTIRIVSRLSKEGLLETKGKTIFIRDIERLKNLPDELI